MCTNVDVKSLVLADVEDPVFQKRFWDFVVTSGHCWEWQGWKDRGGYGKVTLNGKIHRAHRVSYVTAYLHLPESMYVLHTCDNPSCVNPAHLYAGTKADNNKDTRDRGRVGSKNPIVMNRETVKLLRERYAAGETNDNLSTDYGLSHGAVIKICSGQRWAEAGGPISKRGSGRPRK